MVFQLILTIGREETSKWKMTNNASNAIFMTKLDLRWPNFFPCQISSSDEKKSRLPLSRHIIAKKLHILQVENSYFIIRTT